MRTSAVAVILWSCLALGGCGQPGHAQPAQDYQTASLEFYARLGDALKTPAAQRLLLARLQAGEEAVSQARYRLSVTSGRTYPQTKIYSERIELATVSEVPVSASDRAGHRGQPLGKKINLKFWLVGTGEESLEFPVDVSTNGDWIFPSVQAVIGGLQVKLDRRARMLMDDAAHTR